MAIAAVWADSAAGDGCLRAAVGMAMGGILAPAPPEPTSGVPMLALGVGPGPLPVVGASNTREDAEDADDTAGDEEAPTPACR